MKELLKNKKLKNAIILFILFFSANAFYGQNGMPNVTPPTPETANFLKYDFYPTDNTSGALKVQIPIYTIKSKSIELPISLSYHTAGIKVDDIASEAGLGWVINASGFVTVTHKGLSASNGGSAIRNDWLNSQQISALATPSTVPVAQYIRSLEDNNWPTEASIYNYHAPGLTGGYMYKMAVGNTKTIINVPKSTDKIIDSNPTYLGMSVINENGIKYEFTKSESVNNAPTIWHLTKMSDPSSNDAITFEYGITSQETDFSHEGSTISLNTVYNFCPGSEGMLNYIRTSDRQIPLLTKISFNNGYVSFVYSNDRMDRRRYRLQKIEIYDNSNNLMNEIALSQSYFTRGATPNSDYRKNVDFRLKLDNVIYKDKNRIPINSYQFTYNTQYKLPPYLSYDPLLPLNSSLNSAYFGQDLWGYYNGISGNTSFFSIDSHFHTTFTNAQYSNQRDFSSYSNYLANRNVNTDYAQACILTGVRYPTGGITNFTYESNADQAGNKLGGLRISKITQNVGLNETYKEFKYLTANINRFYTPRGGSLYDVYNNCRYSLPPSGNPGTASGTIATMTSFGSQDDLLISGNPVFYSKVEEYEGTMLNNLGKTEYEYEYVQDSTTSINRMNGIYYPKKLYNMVDMSWRRGQLKKMINYKKEGSAFVPVKSTENFYSYFLEETIFTGLDFYKTRIPEYNDFTDGYNYGDILISTGFKKLTSVIEKEIIATGIEIVKNTRYHYDNLNHMQVTRSEFAVSDGVKKNTIFKYPDDISSISSLGSDNLTSLEKAAIDKLKFNDQHRIADIIQSEVFRDSNGNDIKDAGELLNTERTNYKEWAPNLILPEFVQTSKNSFQLEDKIQFHSYYLNGSVKEVSAANGLHTVYIWGYDKSQPIAKIENATYTEVATAIGITTAVLDSYNESNIATINGLRTSLPFAMVTIYTYVPLVGVSSITDSKGYTTYYTYDSFNRLQFIKDKDLNVLQRYCYNYLGQQTDCTIGTATLITYKNVSKSQTFTKQTCTAGLGGSSVVYSVPAGIYSSTVSQAAADVLATNEITANGQNFANANGTCTVPPAAPTELAFVSATANSINFSWNAVAGATSYKIYKNGVHVSTVTSPAVTGTLSGLLSGTSYDVQISAVTAVEGALSTSATMFTLLAAPAGLSFTSATTTSVNFSWTAVTGALSYKIYKDNLYVSSVNAPAVSGSLSGLISGIGYNVQVQASNTSGNGELSSGVVMSPLLVAPTGLTFVSATTSTITMSWNAVTGATGYKILKNGIVAGSSATTTGSLMGLNAGVTYNVQVLAYKGSADGIASSIVGMSATPAVPTGLTLTSATATTLNFSWNSVTGATGYRIYKNGLFVSSVPTTTASLSGLNASTSYDVQVLAYNAVDGDLSSSVSMSTTAPPMGFTKTYGTYPGVGGAVSGTILNNLSTPIYIYVVVQSAGASSGSGSVNATVNGSDISASGTFTQYGQSFPSTSYVLMSPGTINVSAYYSGTSGSYVVFAYSLSPGGPLTYWSNSL